MPKMRHYLPSVGERFGRWTVVSGGNAVAGKTRVVCDCGTVRDVVTGTLYRGNSRSCGCLRSEISGSRFRKHGDTGSRLYNIWRGMRDRCDNHRHATYDCYGGRGIRVCQEWRQSYAAFKEWAASNGYAANLQLDRIDNDRGYEPTNCRFVTRVANCSNTRRTILIDAFGETKTLAEWTRDHRCNAPPRTVTRRIRQFGWSPEIAIATPGANREPKALESGRRASVAHS